MARNNDIMHLQQINMQWKTKIDVYMKMMTFAEEPERTQLKVAVQELLRCPPDMSLPDRQVTCNGMNACDILDDEL